MAWRRLTSVRYRFYSCQSNAAANVVESTLAIMTRLRSAENKVFLSSFTNCFENEVFLHKDLLLQMSRGVDSSHGEYDSGALEFEKVISELSSAWRMTAFRDFTWEIQLTGRHALITQGSCYQGVHNTFVRFTSLHEQTGKFCSFFIDKLDDELVSRVLSEVDDSLQNVSQLELSPVFSLLWSNKAAKALSCAVSVLLQDGYIHGASPYAISPSFRTRFPVISLYREPHDLVVDDAGIPLQRLLVIDKGIPLAWDIDLTRSTQLGIPVIGGQFYDEHLHFYQKNEYMFACDEMPRNLLRGEYMKIDDARYLNYCAEKDLCFFKAKINDKWFITRTHLIPLISSLYLVTFRGKKYYFCHL